jgi:hypothetical protein
VAEPRRSRRSFPLILAVAAALLPLLWRGVQRSPQAPRPPRPAQTARPALPGEAPAAAVPVDEEHLFLGEINRKGRPVGFHSRPGGHDPKGARVVELLDRPNAAGVYTAAVEIRDPSSGRWLRKTSTFYPDRMQRHDVLQAILNAYEGRQGGGEKFRGPSGAGFTIEGYYQNGRIDTAYPIYTRR